MSRRTLFYGALTAIVALGLAAELTNFVRSDVAFLLFAAGRVLDGARLYRDVVEINPPLIIAFNLPAVAAARAFGLSEVLVYRLLVTGLLLGTLGICGTLLRRVVPDDLRLRDGLLLLLAFVLFLLPGIDFGQREHLLLGLVFPYLFLSALRLEGQDVPSGLAFGTGVLAGVGLAMKPHFLLLWLGLEVYLRFRRGWRTRPAPESEAIAGFLILYGLAVLLLTPEYVGLVATLGFAYGGYLHDPFMRVIVTAPGTTVVFLAVLSLAALASRARHRSLWSIFALAVICGFLAGAAQQKGWTYHFLPAAAFGLMLLGLASADVARPLARPAQRLYAAAATGTLVASVVWTALLATSRTLGWNPVQEGEREVVTRLAESLRRHAEGGSLFVFSYTIGSSFPLVNYSGLAWASRFPHLWILEAEYQDQLQAAAPMRYRSPAEMSPAERYLNDAVYQDLATARPTVLLVLKHARDAQVNGLRRLDYIGYFSRDQRIATLLREYRLAEEVGEYLIYRRVDSATPGSGIPPLSRPGTLDIVKNDLKGPRALVLDTGFVVSALVFLLASALSLAREGQGHRGCSLRLGRPERI